MFVGERRVCGVASDAGHFVILEASRQVPQGIAQCDFLQVPPLDLSGITIQVTEATAGDLSPASATVTISETTCPF